MLIYSLNIYTETVSVTRIPLLFLQIMMRNSYDVLLSNRYVRHHLYFHTVQPFCVFVFPTLSFYCDIASKRFTVVIDTRVVLTAILSCCEVSKFRISSLWLHMVSNFDFGGFFLQIQNLWWISFYIKQIVTGIIMLWQSVVIAFVYSYFVALFIYY